MFFKEYDGTLFFPHKFKRSKAVFFFNIVKNTLLSTAVAKTTRTKSIVSSASRTQPGERYNISGVKCKDALMTRENLSKPTMMTREIRKIVQ